MEANGIAAGATHRAQAAGGASGGAGDRVGSDLLVTAVAVLVHRQSLTERVRIRRSADRPADVEIDVEPGDTLGDLLDRAGRADDPLDPGAEGAVDETERRDDGGDDVADDVGDDVVDAVVVGDGDATPVSDPDHDRGAGGATARGAPRPGRRA